MESILLKLSGEIQAGLERAASALEGPTKDCVARAGPRAARKAERKRDAGLRLRHKRAARLSKLRRRQMANGSSTVQGLLLRVQGLVPAWPGTNAWMGVLSAARGHMHQSMRGDARQVPVLWHRVAVVIVHVIKHITYAKPLLSPLASAS